MSSSALTDPFALVGSVLANEYRVDRVVGEGGFGVVYRGFHLGLEQPIAIKVLKGLAVQEGKQREALLAQFKDEAKLLYTLSQESLTIVRAIDFGAVTTPNGAWAPFMVLEWLEGSSLEEDLASRRRAGMRGRKLDEALALLEPAAEGLSVAHLRRVAHRDVKPGNFFLVKAAHGPRLKVLDFGIAKMVSDGAQAGTRAGLSSFTWLYAAPEQIDGKYGQTGLATDVYAFALVLTELLTDRQALEGNDVLSLHRAAIDPVRRPTPRTLGVRDLPEAVEIVCRRALAVDPSARFQSVPDFWSALQTAIAPRRASTMAVPSITASSPGYPAAPQAQGTYPSLTGPSPTGPVTGATQAPAPHAAHAQSSYGYAPQGHLPPPPVGGPMMRSGPAWPAVPPRPQPTGVLVPITIVMFVLAGLFAGSCALVHAACG